MTPPFHRKCGMLAVFLPLLCFFSGCTELVNSGFTYGPGSESSTAAFKPTPGSITFGGSEKLPPDAQVEYDRALKDYNNALASFNAVSAVGSLNDSNWAIQQTSAPGLGKLVAFGGFLAANSNQNNAARRVEIARQQLEVAKQKIAFEAATQPALRSTGRIAIVAFPESAEVLADGRPVGNSPCNLSLREGIHEFHISAAGYKDSSRSIAVITDSEITLRIILEKE